MSSYVQSRVYMDTVVTVEISRPHQSEAALRDTVGRAYGWFAEVERRCSRFDPDSELRSLSRQPGRPVSVSPLLFRAIEFALGVAEASGGAFDPTLGAAMEARGFNCNYLTGELTRYEGQADATAGFRDIVLDTEANEVTLMRPLVLDLGAVAKGLAIDLAGTELSGTQGDFAINAGGDLLLRGRDAESNLWLVGIRNPRQVDECLRVIEFTDAAVCTSGDYERRTPDGAGHHILEPGSNKPAGSVASATVIAPSAMLADALSTAAFVLGPEHGLAFLERQGVDGLLVTPDLDQITTRSFPHS